MTHYDKKTDDIRRRIAKKFILYNNVKKKIFIKHQECTINLLIIINIFGVRDDGRGGRGGGGGWQGEGAIYFPPREDRTTIPSPANLKKEKRLERKPGDKVAI